MNSLQPVDFSHIFGQLRRIPVLFPAALFSCFLKDKKPAGRIPDLSLLTRIFHE